MTSSCFLVIGHRASTGIPHSWEFNLKINRSVKTPCCSLLVMGPGQATDLRNVPVFAWKL